MTALRKVALVFLIAMVVRGFLFAQILDKSEVIFQPDSRMYVSLAEGLSKNGSFAYPKTPERPDVERMPGYPAFLAILVWVFGGSFLAVVAIQIILDSLSCVFIYILGDKIFKGGGVISGILAALNLGMITYCHFILNDSIFLFVFLLFLITFSKLLDQPKFTLIFLIGIELGIAAYIRPVIIYLPLIIIPFLFIYLTIKIKVSPFVAAFKAFLIGIVFFVSLSPWLIRNYIHYGRLSLMAQGGEHLLQYIVPSVWQYSKGIPFIEGMRQVNSDFKERAERADMDIKKINPFEKSEFQVAMAFEYLKEEPLSAFIKAWVFGIVKNLFAPSIIDLSYLLDIERPHFFYTEGNTFLERARNFIAGMEGLFSWSVIGSIIALCVSRLIQIWGIIILLRHKIWEGMLLVCVPLYFLLISGPVGYAKYRLPFEPVLIVMLAMGIIDIYQRLFKTPKES